jgi:hypothetical protein
VRVSIVLRVAVKLLTVNLSTLLATINARNSNNNNALHRQVFKVSTDMPLLTGNTEVTVSPSGSPYNFQYYSSVGGVVCGSITFTDAETGEEETLCG